MRTIAAGLTTHISGTSHTRCNMLLLQFRNGDVIGITDHDEAIDYNLLDAGLGNVVYSAGSGIVPSDVVLMAGVDASNFEASGPLGGLITSRPFSGGSFDRARAWLFQVNWDDVTTGKIPILVGNVSEGRIEGGRFTFQVRSDQDRLNQLVGRLIAPNCSATFGDGQCTMTPESIVGTVTSVSSAIQFTVSFSGSYANDYFNMGQIEPLTGDLVGIPPVEIFDWTSAGVITLFTALPAVPGFGETFTISRGCSKLRMSDDPSVPTCLSYDNVINFRGFSEVPGTDQVLKMPIPGELDE